MEARDRGIFIGGTIINGQLVGGTHYTAEQWAQKLRDDRATRIEAKLDAIIAHFRIEVPANSESDK